jgi:hypothetical protein
MQKKYKNLINLFQNIFKLPPSLVIEDELGCTVSTVIKHKNTKITLEVSELNEEEFENTTLKLPVEFHELKLKNGTSHYIISFFFQNDTAKYVVRVYLE